MSYQPIARKYRPKTFDELVGQPHVTTTLTRAIESGRIGQAYLFCGQRGVGKTSAARILAKSLNCAKGPTPHPCQQCPSCLAIVQGNSLDVIEIDGASNRGIDDIRQLREQVKFSPVHGRFRVYIIDEVHQITPDAFNALLKTLEEPPAHAKFIFATTSPQKVPSTILSRCQRFDFRRLTSQTVVAALAPITKAERIPIDERALYAIARASEGSLRDAEVILEQLASFCDGSVTEQEVSQLLGSLEHDGLLAWAQALLDRDAKAALLFLSQQLDRGKDVTQLLTGLITHFRNLLIARTTDAASSRQALLAQLIDLPEEEIARLDEQAKLASAEELLMMVQILTGAYEWIRRSPFAQEVLEFALIKVATREAWSSLAEILERLERLSPSGPPPSTTPARSSTSPSFRAPPPARTAERASMSASPTPAQPSGSIRASEIETAKAVVELEDEVAGDSAEVVDLGPAPVSPMPSGDVDPMLQQVIERWPRFLERIGQQKMSLASYLTDARPLALAEQVVQVGLPGFSLHHEVLNATESIRLIERTLADLMGQALKVRYTTIPDPPLGQPMPTTSPSIPGPIDEPQAPVPPIVQEIVSLFDAVVMPQPPPKP